MFNIGFVGFGEAASEISIGLSDNPDIKIFAYDILLADPEKKPLLVKKAADCRVTLCNSPADLAGSAEIIFSTVVSSVAYKVAQEIVPYLQKNHVYVDLNAVTPVESEKIASLIEGAGISFIDGAMVGSLKARQHKVPMLVSGKSAEGFIEKMKPHGFNMSFVGEKPGVASGNKLIRSVFTKGLAALLIETLICAKKLGYYDAVLSSMISTMKADPADLISRLVTGTIVHSQRRLGELSGSREMLLQSGLESKMIEATLEVITDVNNAEIDQDSVTGKTETAIDLLSSVL